MRLTPAFEAFAPLYGAGGAQVVWTTLVADTETPVSALMKLAKGQPNAFLFESVEGGAIIGRYSFLGIKPDVIWRCSGDKAEINRRAGEDPEAFETLNAGALDSLRALVAESRIELPPELPPMAAAVVGYMGYDTVRLMERLPDTNPDVLGVPDAMFLRPTVMAVFDRLEDQLTLVTPVWPREGVAEKAAYEAASARLAAAVADFERPLSFQRAPDDKAATLPEAESNITREAYHGIVERAKEYIRAGDIFQVVPSQRFRLPFELPPLALYRALRRLNPSPFLFFLDFGGFTIVGSSPEILVRLREGTVTIRPIAGTRPRGKTPAEDRALAEELLADPKERAEHLMLLDLGRNDVGRVAKVGSVKVTEDFLVERYSHVMHIVSNVEGELDPAYDAVTALIAGFPAGTVSGAPKVRAMEIIDELESERRGIYAGAVGYFGANGDMDTCIALRTAVIKDGIMYVQAGGGVVADSDPEAEYQETRNKARALMRAAEEAVRFAGTGD
ncbi:MAG: anthranilate synthase component I [Kiloniellales bacterium]|jgi:anthranilate synthase component 1